MRSNILIVTVVVAALALAACGEGSGDSDEASAATQPNARDAAVQKEIAGAVKREARRVIEAETGGFVDPELQPTTVECLPESDTKLSCIADGYVRAGFGDAADPYAEGPFTQRWEVIVDPDTGRYQLRQVG